MLLAAVAAVLGLLAAPELAEHLLVAAVTAAHRVRLVVVVELRVLDPVLVQHLAGCTHTTNNKQHTLRQSSTLK